MAVEPEQSDDRDDDVDADRELTNDVGGELSHGQAEAILSREMDVREDVVDVLRDLEADVRSDPAKLKANRLDALDDAIGELMAFSRDLHELEPKGGDDGFD